MRSSLLKPSSWLSNSSMVRCTSLCPANTPLRQRFHTKTRNTPLPPFLPSINPTPLTAVCVSV